ncbi:MAG: phosphoribosylformimino-5-aminoimidazole carboxamide ribotide isomerase [Lachnospiraceae bacterium]|nr:phosphoribosylformimino-5-aminoimidazole carboxamide ribotide isomerase [Lachnospiraceae bacterium]
MEFRPCIDIHDGKVKQIVGGSLKDHMEEGKVAENFVATQDAAFYAKLYKEKGLKGGHVILLNAAGTLEYEETKKQALLALKEYPGGLQVGGGINPSNAKEFLDAGASHVIVTSYVFRDGKIDYERLEEMVRLVGKEHLVLDLSCRKKGDEYYIVTDRWQKYTDTVLSTELLNQLENYADEYLIHAVDVEGKSAGIDEVLVAVLGGYEGIPVTYAGGVHSMEDLEGLKNLGKKRVNVTVGSALDLFGGTMNWERVVTMCE